MCTSMPQGLVGTQGGPPTSAVQRDRMLSATQRLQASSQSLEAARGVLNQAQVGVDIWRRANFTHRRQNRTAMSSQGTTKP